jgi:hypothetical protein
MGSSYEYWPIVADFLKSATRPFDGVVCNIWMGFQKTVGRGIEFQDRQPYPQRGIPR